MIRFSSQRLKRTREQKANYSNNHRKMFAKVVCIFVEKFYRLKFILRSLATLLGTLLQSNVMQYNSSYILAKIILFSFVWCRQKSLRVLFAAVVSSLLFDIDTGVYCFVVAGKKHLFLCENASNAFTVTTDAPAVLHIRREACRSDTCETRREIYPTCCWE